MLSQRRNLPNDRPPLPEFLPLLLSVFFFSVLRTCRVDATSVVTGELSAAGESAGGRRRSSGLGGEGLFPGRIHETQPHLKTFPQEVNTAVGKASSSVS